MPQGTLAELTDTSGKTSTPPKSTLGSFSSHGIYEHLVRVGNEMKYDFLKYITFCSKVLDMLELQ